VADAVLGLLDDLPADVVDQVTSTLLGALEKTAYELQSDPELREQLTTLSTRHMQTVFNPKYVDDPRVAYSSYAGRTNLESGWLACRGGAQPNDPFALDVVRPLLLPSALFLEADGLQANDGLVSVDSARWGTFQRCVPADHIREVGHSGPTLTFDHLAFFRGIVARLRSARL
jgi:triacylglycerol lipase